MTSFPPIPPPVPAPASQTAHGDGPAPWLYRLWLYGYVALFAIGLIAVISSEMQTLAGQLTGLLMYMSLANSFLPLPTTGPILYLGGEFSIPEVPGIVSLATVGALCAVGTVVANVNEYFLISFVFRSRRVARLRETRVYGVAARFFERRPFLLIVGMNMLPIPVDVVRWLAIAHRYPLRRYAAAIFCGRWIRYFALLWLGDMLDLPLWAIGMIIAVLGLAGLARAAALRFRIPIAG